MIDQPRERFDSAQRRLPSTAKLAYFVVTFSSFNEQKEPWVMSKLKIKKGILLTVAGKYRRVHYTSVLSLVLTDANE